MNISEITIYIDFHYIEDHFYNRGIGFVESYFPNDLLYYIISSHQQ